MCNVIYVHMYIILLCTYITYLHHTYVCTSNAYIRTYVHMYVLDVHHNIKCIYIRTYTYVHTYIYTYIHTYIHTCILIQTTYIRMLFPGVTMFLYVCSTYIILTYVCMYVHTGTHAPVFPDNSKLHTFCSLRLI